MFVLIGWPCHGLLIWLARMPFWILRHLQCYWVQVKKSVVGSNCPAFVFTVVVASLVALFCFHCRFAGQSAAMMESDDWTHLYTSSTGLVSYDCLSLVRAGRRSHILGYLGSGLALLHCRAPDLSVVMFLLDNGIRMVTESSVLVTVVTVLLVIVGHQH